MRLAKPMSDIVQEDVSRPPAHVSILRTVLSSWEIIPIMAVTAVLCLYRIDMTEFNPDQAALFSMARYVVQYGLIPLTSNGASVGLAHPPGVIYLLILPALFSGNPIGAAIMQGLLTTLAVLLTYIFTRRYYGRLAAIVAALLYGTAASTIHFGRFIWQPNIMSPLIPLFLFALFWGVVERRRGWLAPAVLLLGFIVQAHESAALLGVLLLIAVVLAFKTLRWRDIWWSIGALLLVFLPFLYWEIHARFIDLHVLLSLSKQHAIIDSQAINYYRTFLLPFGQQPTIASSVINTVYPFIYWMRYAIPLLVFCGGVTAALLLLQALIQPPKVDESVSARRGIGGLWARWQATPSNGGLLLLLVWQIVPLLVLSRHTVVLQLHYLLFLMPGPFILIGLLFAKCVELLRSYHLQWNLIRFGVYVLTAILVIAQLVGSIASLIDITAGNFNDRTFYTHYRNDLGSLQHALSEADAVARQHHLGRVYVTTDASTAPALQYLSGQIMQTPTTLFDATDCLVLPAASKGPAILLVGPYDVLTNDLLNQFASQTLVEQIARPGGLPFRLYIVTTTSETSSTSEGGFANNLQLLHAQTLNLHNSPLLLTQWSMLHSAQPALRTNYNYIVTVRSGGETTQGQSQQCSFSSMQVGDQLLVASPLSSQGVLPTSVTIAVQSFTSQPLALSRGPLHFETYINDQTSPVALKTSAGSTTITVPKL